MLLSIGTWWNSMNILENIYWCFAIPFTLIFLFQLITFVIDIGNDADPEYQSSSNFDSDSDSGIGFQPITFKNFIAFSSIFGWTGIICIEAGLGNGLSIFLSIIAGIGMMLIMAILVYFMNSLFENKTAKIDSPIGRTAIVNLRIPANKDGAGKVQINIQGNKILDAVTENLEDIKSGSLVKIIGIDAGGILLVELL